MFSRNARSSALLRLDAPPRSARFPSRRCRLCALAALATVFVLQSGCMTTSMRDWVANGFKVGPDYLKPPAPVAADWIEYPGVSSDPADLTAWWTVFNDPQLDALIQTAYNQNLTLRTAGTRVLQARAQQAIAVGYVFPQSQEAFGQYSRINLSQNQANNPTAVGAFLPPGTPAVFSDYYSDWQTGFSLSWELDFWGRFRRNIESANAELDASVEDYDAALVTLLADVAENYTRYRVAQQRINIARTNLKIQTDVLNLAEERFRVGTSTRLDVEQAKTVVGQTSSMIPALEIELGRANDALCVLLGMPPSDLQSLLGAGANPPATPLPHIPDSVAAGLPADLLRQRPDVRSAERQIAAQSAKIGVAEADLYPAFYINGTIGYEAQDLSKLLESQSFMGTVVPNFRWNILNYGRIINNIWLQEARTLELIATYQQTVLNAGRETQTSLRGFVKSREQADDLQESVTAARSATDLGLEQYRTGTVNFNTVFNLETTQVQQEDQWAVARGNIALSLIEVYRALGGGWEMRLSQPSCARLPALEEIIPPPEAAPIEAAHPDSLPAPKAAGEKP